MEQLGTGISERTSAKIKRTSVFFSPPPIFFIARARKRIETEALFASSFIRVNDLYSKYSSVQSVYALYIREVCAMSAERRRRFLGERWDFENNSPTRRAIVSFGKINCGEAFSHFNNPRERILLYRISDVFGKSWEEEKVRRPFRRPSSIPFLPISKIANCRPVCSVAAGQKRATNHERVSRTRRRSLVPMTG